MLGSTPTGDCGSAMTAIRAVWLPNHSETDFSFCELVAPNTPYSRRVLVFFSDSNVTYFVRLALNVTPRYLGLDLIVDANCFSLFIFFFRAHPKMRYDACLYWCQGQQC